MRDPLAQAAAIDGVMGVKRSQAQMELADRERARADMEKRFRRDKLRDKHARANGAEIKRKREFMAEYRHTERYKEYQRQRHIRRNAERAAIRELAELLS